MTNNPPLKETMPEYEGPEKDPEEAVKFLKKIIIDTLVKEGLKEKVDQLEVVTMNLVELSACADSIDYILMGFRDKKFIMNIEEGSEMRLSQMGSDAFSGA